MAERDGFGGIGRIRDIGDPYDSRRGNPRPQRVFSSKEELEDFLVNEELNRRAAIELEEQELLAGADDVRKQNDRLIAKQTGWETTVPREYQVGYSGVDTEEPRTITREDGKTYANPFYREKGAATDVDLGKTKSTEGGLLQRKFAPGIGAAYIERKQATSNIESRVVRDAFLELDPVKASQILSQSAGKEITPQFAGRVQQFLEALPELDVQGASYLAIQESTPGGISREALQRLAQSGEIGADPAVSAVAKAVNEGVIDETRSIESQARAVDPYMKAATDEKTKLIEKYKDMANASVGVKPKKAAEIVNPYLVPALMAEATEEYQGKRQPATYWDAPYPKGRIAINPRNVRLELLDPSALISERTAADLSLAYRDRETGELMRPTLGGAVNSLMQENRTPLIAIPDKEVKSEIRKTKKGKKYRANVFRGQEVSRFGDSGEAGYGDYRVGNTSAYKDEMYNIINDLIERETGMQLVTNQGIRDDKMAKLQKGLLARASTDPTANPTTELINLLAEGRNIDRNLGSQDTELSILATDRAKAEKEFYLQEGYQEVMQRYRNEAAIAQGSSNQPMPAEVKTSTYAYDNAPQTPSSRAPSTDNAVQSVNQANIPAGSRPITEQAPTFQRAVDFLTRFRRGKGI